MSTSRRRRRGVHAAPVRLMVVVLFVMGAFARSSAQNTAAPEVVKAALLYNFAKFAEWPTLPAGAPIVVCIVGDDGIASAFVETVRGQTIGSHALSLWRPPDMTTWRVCHVLFVADTEMVRSSAGLGGVKSLPVLTVSDSTGFAQTGGIIELYVEGKSLRFIINVDAADRSGLRLSSKLLGLARIMRSAHGP